MLIPYHIAANHLKTKRINEGEACNCDKAGLQCDLTVIAHGHQAIDITLDFLAAWHNAIDKLDMLILSDTHDKDHASI